MLKNVLYVLRIHMAQMDHAEFHAIKGIQKFLYSANLKDDFYLLKRNPVQNITKLQNYNLKENYNIRRNDFKKQ